MGLGPYDERVQVRVAARVYPHLLHHLVQPAGITRDGVQGRSPEIGDELDLTLGVACRGGDRKHAQPLGAVLETQPAREHAVSRRILEDVARAQPHHIEAARHGIGPFVEILLRVQDHRGRPRRAARRMEAHNAAQRDGGHLERIAVAQILFRRERDPAQVGQRPYVVGGDMVFGEALAVKFGVHTLPDCPFQTFELQGFNLRSGQFLKFGVQIHGHRNL